jgi:hypothetical protein
MDVFLATAQANTNTWRPAKTGARSAGKGKLYFSVKFACVGQLNQIVALQCCRIQQLEEYKPFSCPPLGAFTKFLMSEI